LSRILKEALKKSVPRLLHWGDKTKVGRYIFEQAQNMAMARTQQVEYKGTTLTFSLPNDLNRFRIQTFASKEPETLQWIESIPSGSIVWDIGANIGLYTCYAAKARQCRVFAFEPSVFNLELLARNVFLNALIGQVTLIPLPLTEQLAINTLSLTTTEWGGALSTFGENYGHDGQAINKVFEFSTLGISIADAVEHLHIPHPDYIKMDVDGIEHLILKGGLSVLKKVKSILIEINDAFEEQKISSVDYLTQAGLTLKEKRRAEMFENGMHQYSYNQIWHRIGKSL
jgi:FkbM family methyltransferase